MLGNPWALSGFGDFSPPRQNLGTALGFSFAELLAKIKTIRGLFAPLESTRVGRVHKRRRGELENQESRKQRTKASRGPKLKAFQP